VSAATVQGAQPAKLKLTVELEVDGEKCTASVDNKKKDVFKGHHTEVEWTLSKFDGCPDEKRKDVTVEFPGTSNTPPFQEKCIRVWTKAEYGQAKRCQLDPAAVERIYRYMVKFDGAPKDPELIVRRQPIKVELTLVAGVCRASGSGTLLANADSIAFDVDDQCGGASGKTVAIDVATRTVASLCRLEWILTPEDHVRACSVPPSSDSRNFKYSATAEKK
jgi:hypothetical protein